MASEIDWQAEARRSANRISDEVFKAHRGAMPWRDLGISVVFGNDGYGLDGRSRHEVALVRSRLVDVGLTELGFGTDEDGYTWAMIVRTDDIDLLDTAVWESWNVACGEPPGTVDGFRAYQQGIARTAVFDMDDPGPKASIN